MATRIMVINDTQEILDMFRAILEEEGELITSFLRGKNSCKAPNSTSFHLSR